jgi:hypothetical protein
MKVPGQPRQIVQETPVSKITKAKWTGGVSQAVHSPELNPQSHQKKPTFTLDSSKLIPGKLMQKAFFMSS